MIAAGLAWAALTVCSALLLMWNNRLEQIRAWRCNVDTIAATVAANADQTIRAVDLVRKDQLKLPRNGKCELVRIT